MSLRGTSFGENEFEFLQLMSMKRRISKSPDKVSYFTTAEVFFVKSMTLQLQVFKLTFVLISASFDFGETDTAFDANSSCTC